MGIVKSRWIIGAVAELCSNTRLSVWLEQNIKEKMACGGRSWKRLLKGFPKSLFQDPLIDLKGFYKEGAYKALRGLVRPLGALKGLQEPYKALTRPLGAL